MARSAPAVPTSSGTEVTYKSQSLIIDANKELLALFYLAGINGGCVCYEIIILTETFVKPD